MHACRTFTKIDTSNREAFNKLAAEIKNFFQETNEESDFDACHEEWCNSFIVNLKKFNNYDARYGHAQKVVNMAFKYLLCCDGAYNKQEVKEKFANCHMPLDKYTLLWFFSVEGDYYENWSHLNDEKYKEIQKAIRGKLETDILEKELYIWAEMSKHVIVL